MFNEKTAVWVREGDRIPPTVDSARGRYEATTRTEKFNMPDGLTAFNSFYLP